MAFFLVPFMCVWSGFSIGGIYGSQIAKGQFDLLASLFGIPFVIGTLIFGSIALMCVCGRVIVSVDRHDGRIFLGIGSCGWTWRFDWAAIATIEEGDANHRGAGSSGRAILLRGQTVLKFGSMLSEARRDYVLRALRRLLAQRDLYPN